MRLLSRLSGDDIFISYSRKDGSLYAAVLADKLTGKHFSCFIDRSTKSLTAAGKSAALFDFSPDSKLLKISTFVPQDEDRTYVAAIKDLSTMKLVPLKEARRAATLKFSPRSNWIWVIPNLQQDALEYWNTKTGVKRTLLQCGRDPVFSSDESRLITSCADGTIKFWDLASGQEVLSIPTGLKRIVKISLSPDDTSMLILSDGAVQLWRIKL